MESLPETPLISSRMKWTLAAWLIVWLVLHLRAYPASSLLWFCAYGNAIVVAGVLLESRLLLSWQAVALLAPQSIYVLDVIAQLLGARHSGGTAYLFDAATPASVRALSLFHFIMPVILAWTIARLGYDVRALPMQLVTSAIVLPLSFSFGAMNINGVWGPFNGPRRLPPVAHLAFAFAMYAAIYACSHALLLTFVKSAAPNSTRVGPSAQG